MAIGIAAAALVVSLSTFFVSRWRDRRDLFLRIHERLASVDQQQGRRLIHQLLREDQKAISDLDPQQYSLINHTLSNLNVACFYYCRGYVRRDDMLDIWGLALVRTCDAAQPFLTYRESENEGVQPWPELTAFVHDAREHLSSRERPFAIPLFRSARRGQRLSGSQAPRQP
jgi:hypothetical protein